ncbi:MAG TPA: GTPase domain-containing protein [Myxococcota bacterium]|nr:GTPase domain-containing protein [Myxococcota bacterium]
MPWVLLIFFCVSGFLLAADKTKEMASRNILLIGNMQMGKSSFIKLLYKISQMPPPETLKIGRGSTATTRECTHYKIAFTPTICSLEEFYYGRKLNLNYKAEPKPDGDPFELNIIDTPGLAEGPEIDDQHMVELLMSIQHLKSVHAIIFVLSKGESFTQEVTKKLEYLRELFANFDPVFIILHTKWDSMTGTNTAEEDMLLRQKSFEQQLPSFPITKAFFINSVWDEKNSKDARTHFAEHKKALAYNTVNALLNFIGLVEAAPGSAIAQSMYRKTEFIKVIERRIYSAVLGTIDGLSIGAASLDLDEIANKVSEIFNRFVSIQAILAYKTDLERQSKNYAKRQTVASTHEAEQAQRVVTPYGLLKRVGEQEYTYTTKLPVLRFRQSNIAGYFWSQSAASEDGKTSTFKLTCPLDKVCNGHRNQLVLLADLTSFHLEEIDRIKNEVIDLERQINAKQSELAKEIENIKGFEKYWELIQQYGKTCARLKTDYCPINIHLRLWSEIYAKYSEKHHSGWPDNFDFVAKFIELGNNE